MSKSTADPPEGTEPLPLISSGHSWCLQNPREEPRCAQWNQGWTRAFQPARDRALQPGPQGSWNQAPQAAPGPCPLATHPRTLLPLVH